MPKPNSEDRHDDRQARRVQQPGLAHGTIARRDKLASESRNPAVPSSGPNTKRPTMVLFTRSSDLSDRRQVAMLPEGAVIGFRIVKRIGEAFVAVMAQMQRLEAPEWIDQSDRQSHKKLIYPSLAGSDDRARLRASARIESASTKPRSELRAPDRPARQIPQTKAQTA